MATKRELLNLLDTTENNAIRNIRDYFNTKLIVPKQQLLNMQGTYKLKVIEKINALTKQLGAILDPGLSVEFGTDLSYRTITVNPEKVPGMGKLCKTIKSLEDRRDERVKEVSTEAGDLRSDLTLYGPIPAVKKDLEAFITKNK